MRLIDADKLKTSLNETVDAAIKWHEDCLGEIMQNRSEAAIMAFIECIQRINGQPTADAVEVVRCKDCKHRPHIEKAIMRYREEIEVCAPKVDGREDYSCMCLNPDNSYFSWMPDDDWFCADGERREDEG